MPPINKVWASNAGSNDTSEITVPSGQTCRVRRIGIEGMIAAGILAEADALTAIVSEGPVADGKARMRGHKRPAAEQEMIDDRAMMVRLLKDQSGLQSIITLVDKAVPLIVVEPVVMLHYEVDDDGKQTMLSKLRRAAIEKENPGVVFTDQIDLVDKMHLFEWATGSLVDTMGAFRPEPDSTVDSLAVEPSVSRPSKRTPRRR